MNNLYRIVWITSNKFSTNPIKSTGSWLKPMADGLIESKQIKLYNITRDSNTREDSYGVENGIEQWILGGHTYGEGHKDVLPKWLCEKIQNILDKINPDVVHIWGTESKWITVFTQGYIKYPCFLDMQGVMSGINVVYSGCIGVTDIIRISLCLHDVIHPRQSFLYKLYYWNRRSHWEHKMIKKIPNVSVQSKWTENQVLCMNPNANIWHTNIILREEFYTTEPWEQPNNESPILFAGASSSSMPYKGFHILIQALFIVKEAYPRVCLKIMGKKPDQGLLTDGYIKYLWRLIKKLGLEDNVIFLGSLSASEIICEMKTSNMAVQPSFVESYSLALAEAMMVGLPCISAYSGAIPELGDDGKEQLLYTPTDYNSLAQKILLLFSNKHLARDIGLNARQRRMRENNPKVVVQKQIDIYRNMMCSK